MKLRQWIVAFVLLLLVAADVMGVLWTRSLPEPTDSSSAGAASPGTAKKTSGRKTAQVQAPLVDERPLQTAQRLAATASTAEEQALAHQAVKVADHEGCLGFDRFSNAQLRRMFPTLFKVDDEITQW